MKPTRGPWTVELRTQDGPAILGADSYIVAEIGTVSENGKREMANARLIAAAPTMLEALQNIEDAATLIEERWSEGDLADAVRSLMVDRDSIRALIANIRRAT